MFAVIYEVKLKKQLRGEQITQRSTIKGGMDITVAHYRTGTWIIIQKKKSLYLIQDADFARYKDKSMNACSSRELVFLWRIIQNTRILHVTKCKIYWCYRIWYIRVVTLGFKRLT